MSKSGKKKITSVFRDYRATECSLSVFVFNEMEKYIRLDTTCRMFSWTYPETPKKTSWNSLLEKKICPSYSPCFNTVNVKAEIKNAINTSELLI